MAEVTESHDADDTAPGKLSGKALKDMLAEARERFQYANDYDSDNRKEALADTEFVWKKGAQWPAGVRAERDKDWQPCLEASQLTQFIKQVVNDQRQNRPGIKVSAASGDASEDTAKILQGMVRHIEYDSRAEAVYDTAFEHAVTSGRGYWRIVSDYESPQSFNQKIDIKPIADFQSAYIDPGYLEPDACDAKWAFVTERMTRKAFKAAYPDASDLDWQDEESRHWFGDEDIVVADYYRRVCDKQTLLLIEDGTSVWKDQWEAQAERVLAEGGVPPKPVNERQADRYRVEWFKLAGGQQMLEQYQWRGTYIPVIQVPGDEMMLNGKRIYQGLIRRVRDLQMAYNYLISAAMERVALAPKAPYIMAEGQDEGFENDWAEANRKPFSTLKYKPVDVGGTPAPPPMRQSPVQAEMGLFQQAEALKQDIKSVLGMYESSLGMRGQETSGRAIIAREKQGDNATFNFVDNLSRAIAHTGRIILELIPHYYDTQRVVGIVQDDDTKSTVTINEQQPAFGEAMQAIVKNNVTEGRYAVAVHAGPSYATRRKETAELTAQLVQAFPPLMQVAGDLIVKSQELPDAEAFAERLKVMLPPPIQQMLQAKEQGQQPPDPAMLAQMQQMGQQLQMAQQAMQEMQMELQQAKAGAQEKQAAAQIGAQVDMQTAEIDAQTELQKAQLQARTALQKAEIDARTKLIVAKIMQPAPEMADGEVDVDTETGEVTHRPNPQNEALMALAAQVAQMAQIAAAPRSQRVLLDDEGNVIGAVSELAQQE